LIEQQNNAAEFRYGYVVAWALILGGNRGDRSPKNVEWGANNTDVLPKLLRDVVL